MEKSVIAFSTLEKRIAPVFDTSSELRVVTFEDKKEAQEEKVILTQSTVYELLDVLENLGITQLVCGAVSWELQNQIEMLKIEVLPFITGDFEAVKSAWINSELTKEVYIMPGCCGRRIRGGGKGMGRGMMNAQGRDGVMLGRRGMPGVGRGCGQGYGRGTGLGAQQGAGFGRGLGLGFGRGLGLGRGMGYNACNVNNPNNQGNSEEQNS